MYMHINLRWVTHYQNQFMLRVFWKPPCSQSKHETTFTHSQGEWPSTKMSLWCRCCGKNNNVTAEPNMDFLAAGVYDDPGQVWCDSANCEAVTGELSCTVTLDINSFTESHAETQGIPSQQRGRVHSACAYIKPTDCRQSAEETRHTKTIDKAVQREPLIAGSLFIQKEEASVDPAL